MAGHVIVPHTSLSSDALSGLVEEFVTREGTDYGLEEHSLDAKRRSVLRQIERGEVLIVFDVESESTTLVHRDELPPALRSRPE
jgi:uncharacterized protein YheU (UPF0270 family)